MNADTITMGECIALGLFPGSRKVTKMGYVTGVEGTEVDIWSVGGTYLFPTVAQQMEVVSSSAQDTATTGTGAWTVKIWYLDSTFREKTEIITLNGTNVVPTVATDIYRINNYWVMTAGTGGKAAGNIDIRHLSNSPIYSRIGTGQTRARNSAYTVPFGKKFYIWMISYGASSATGKDVRFTLRSTYNSLDNVVSTLFYPESEIGLQDNTQPFVFPIPPMFPAGTDMKASAISSSGAAAICTIQYRGALLS